MDRVSCGTEQGYDSAGVSNVVEKGAETEITKGADYSRNTAITVGAFASKVKELEHLLSEASEIGQAEDQRNVLNELRVVLNQGVETWPKYDVLRAQNLLRGVEETFDATRGRLAPRRKFRFRTATRENASSTQKLVPALPSEDQTLSKQTEKKANKYEVADVSGSCIEGEVLIEVSESSGHGPYTIGDDRDVGGRAVVVRGEGHGNKVALKDGSRSVRVIGLSQCVIETGNVDGSVWISDCTKCLFRTQCRQLRVHSSSHCRLFVHVSASPIIEKCSKITFGPLSVDSATDGQKNKWSDVADMSSLQASGSDNWTFASLPADDDDTWVFSVPK